MTPWEKLNLDTIALNINALVIDNIKHDKKHPNKAIGHIYALSDFDCNFNKYDNLECGQWIEFRTENSKSDLQIIHAKDIINLISGK